MQSGMNLTWGRRLVDASTIQRARIPSGRYSPQTIWPFFHVLVAADDDDLEAWAMQDFGADRQRRPKGVVEVIL